MSPSTPKYERLSEETIEQVKAQARTGEGIRIILESLGTPKMTHGSGRGCSCCPFPNHTQGNVNFSWSDDGQWFCFGCEEAGKDGISLYGKLNNIDYKGSGFAKAVRELGGLYGSYIKSESSNQNHVQKRVITTNTDFLSWQEQIACHQLFENIVNTIDPEASKRGLQWLSEVRGIDPRIAQKNGRYFHFDDRFYSAFNAELKNLNNDELLSLTKIGVVKKDHHDEFATMVWFSEGVLMGTLGKNESLIDLRMRFLQGNVRYMSPRKLGVINDQGITIKPRSVPFGVNILDECASNKSELLIVEGAIKALGAQCLGKYAIAMNGRPGFKDIAEIDEGSSQLTMLKPLIPKLKQCHRVTICADLCEPPKDSSSIEESRIYRENMAKNKSNAWELAKWLHTQRVDACAESTSVSSRGHCGAVPYVDTKTGEVVEKFVKDFDDAVLLKKHGWIPQSMANGTAKVLNQRTISSPIPQQNQLNNNRDR